MSKRLLLSLIVLTAGCASEAPTTAASCDARAKVDGVCPGVTSGAVTADGIACTATIEATPADVDGKLASAGAGSCVMLSAATFGALNVPANVSLIGKGSSSTSVSGIKIIAGGAAFVRGVKIGGSGLSVSGKGNLTIDRVHVADVGKFAGISATDTNLTITASTIENGGGFGVAAACKTDCATSKPTLTMRRVLVRNNKVVGIWAHGVDTTLEGVQVAESRTQNFLYGRGIEIAEGGFLRASSFAVLDNEDVGLYVDRGGAELTNFTVSNNVRGIQLQAIPTAGAKLNDFLIENNKAIGIGITQGSLGIIVQGGRVAGTKSMNVPVDIGGIQEVGDGINWLGGSEVAILSSVKVESSGRAAVIIEANGKGKFEGALGGGDETRGIIVQGGLEPSMPATLSMPAGMKTEVRLKADALPVAAMMGAATSP
jgi:hypothetical protein